MADSDHTLRLSAAITTSFGTQLRSALSEADQAILSRNYMRLVTGSREPIEPTKRRFNNFEIYSGKLFRAFNVVSHSLERMRDIEKYLRVFPFPRRLGISRATYLRFLAEAYLGELYTFKERIKLFCTIVERSWRRTPDATRVQQASSFLQQAIEQSLHHPVTARGAHVHAGVRFEDPDIERVGFLEFTLEMFHNTSLPASGQDHIGTLRLVYDSAYRDARKAWVKQVRANNEACTTLLEMCSEAFTPILVDDNGDLVDPYNRPRGARSDD